MYPDRQLVHMAQKGNRAAFEILAIRYRDPVLNLAFDFVRDYERAKEVAQEVFIKAFKNIGDIEENSRFLSWLFKITAHACLDTNKGNTGRRKYLLGVKNRKDVKPKLEQPEKETSNGDILVKKVRELSDQQQIAIVLRYFHKSSVREIADVLDCTESKVRGYLRLALQKLNKIQRKRK